MTVHRLAQRVVLAVALMAPAIARAQITITDPNFVFEPVYSGNGMVSMQFGPGGRMYVCEKRGRLLVLTPDGSGGFNAPVVFVDLTADVEAAQESGLLGLALDPDFATNQHIYVLHSTSTDQRILELTADASLNQISGSPRIVLSGLPRALGTHKAGDIHFHPNDPDNLYVVLGDDGNPSGAGNNAIYNGKILRVSKTDGRGLMSNPFWNGNANSIESRIWARGFRNPFRFTFHPLVPQANVMYASENGDMTDRLVRVEMGGDGAWNFNGDNGGFLNPPDARVHILTTNVPYNVGVLIVQGGPFADQANPSDAVIYLSNGHMPTFSGSIRRWRLTGANYDTLMPVAADGGQPFVNRAFGVDMEMGPDGAIYLTSTGTFESDNTSMLFPFEINRIRPVGGAPPIAAFTMSPSPARGPAPLSVTFTDGSSDSDGSITTRLWNFGDGMTSAMTNPTHVFQNARNYTVSLTVTDDTGLQASATQMVTAIQATNVSLRGNVFDGRNRMGQGLGAPVQLRLYQEDGTTPIVISGGVGPMMNGVNVPAGGVINSDVTVELTGAGMVVSVAENVTAVKAAFAGFSIPPGTMSVTKNLTFYLSNTAMRGTVKDTRGAPAVVDIGVSRGDESMLYAVPGGRDYLMGSGLPSTGVTHRIVSDELGYYYLPIAMGDGGSTFFIGAVADTNRAMYVPATFSLPIAGDALVPRDIMVGLQAGGMGCDDLSAVVETPRIDYAAQIQPIWDQSCTGCHNATGSANAGLHLEGAMESYRAIVGVVSGEVPGRFMVDPGNPMTSFLMEKINCGNPQVGTQMRPMDRLSLAEQALIRDWISQGAVEHPGDPPVDAGTPPDTGIFPDANVPTPDDASMAGMDATSGGQDAGGRTRGEASGSCGCTTATSSEASSVLVILAGLFLSRRATLRRSRRSAPQK